MDTCAICTGTPFQSDGYDHDLRTLRLTNMYKLDEGSDRLKRTGPTFRDPYEITTCKQCRGEFMELLWAWANGDELAKRTDTLDPNRQIPIRRAGRQVLVTYDEWLAEREKDE